MRTLVKRVFESTDKDDAQTLLREAVSYVDRAAGKGLIHPNNAARKKARLTKHVNNL